MASGIFKFCEGGMVWILLLLVVTLTCGVTDDIDNHWAVIVCSSRYWFNYRHLTNALAIYWAVKAQGMPDERIILMNAHPDAANDHRNSFPGFIVGHARTKRRDDPLDDLLIGAEFDYLGEDVNPRTFTQLLTGRDPSYRSENQILRTNKNSSIFIFLSGHGGNEFLKFHDNEEISSLELGQAFSEMYLKGRYGSILFVADTCQAASLGNNIFSPNVVTLTSSKVGENSYSYSLNSDLGVSVIDRFSYVFANYFKEAGKLRKDEDGNSKSTSKRTRHTLQRLFSTFDFNFLHSTATVEVSVNSTTVSLQTPLSQFFSGSDRTIRGDTGSYSAVRNTTGIWQPTDYEPVSQPAESHQETSELSSLLDDYFEIKQELLAASRPKEG
jgi:phosphatidylinositol glycan class K